MNTFILFLFLQFISIQVLFAKPPLISLNDIMEKYYLGFHGLRGYPPYYEVLEKSVRFREYEQACKGASSEFLSRKYDFEADENVLSTLYYNLFNLNEISYQYYKAWITMKYRMSAYRTSDEATLAKNTMIDSFECGIFNLEPIVGPKINIAAYEIGLIENNYFENKVLQEISIPDDQKEVETRRVLAAVFDAYKFGIMRSIIFITLNQRMKMIGRNLENLLSNIGVQYIQTRLKL